ncbi:hypothetical protein ACHQM5_004338 [Ranunculus cassubicifolius]
MSQEESSPLPAPHPNQTQGTPLRRQMVEFNDLGKAIGPHAAKYSTQLGKMTRQHCPPIYSKWPEVPTDDKDEMWKGVVVSIRPLVYYLYDMNISSAPMLSPLYLSHIADLILPLVVLPGSHVACVYS